MDDKELEEFGYWLEDTHSKEVIRMEIKLCNCYKGKTAGAVGNTYPGCVDLHAYPLREMVEDLYWKIVYSNLLKKYPELGMEYYMVGKD